MYLIKPEDLGLIPGRNRSAKRSSLRLPLASAFVPPHPLCHDFIILLLRVCSMRTRANYITIKSPDRLRYKSTVRDPNVRLFPFYVPS